MEVHYKLLLFSGEVTVEEVTDCGSPTVGLQHHPGQSRDRAGVSGAAPRAQHQDQLCQRAEFQRDAGLLRHPGHC